MPREWRDDNRPVNMAYETKRQSLGVKPAYGAHLPKVFPYRIKLSPDAAGNVVTWLLGFSDRPGLWHAVSGHPMTADQWVWLWLSKDASDALVEADLISSDSLEETIHIAGGRK